MYSVEVTFVNDPNRWFSTCIQIFGSLEHGIRFAKNVNIEGKRIAKYRLVNCFSNRIDAYGVLDDCWEEQGANWRMDGF